MNVAALVPLGLELPEVPSFGDVRAFIVDALSVTDMFMAGVGFDIAGATLLAVGLFKEPGRLAVELMHKGTRELLDAGRDFVDGIFGLASLLVGFVLQAAGYIVLLGRHPDEPFGWPVAVTGLVCLVCAAALPLWVWGYSRDWLFKKYLIDLARHDNAGGVYRHPDLDDLLAYGRALDLERYADEHGDEGDKLFVRRVFGVTQFRSPDDPPLYRHGLGPPSELKRRR
jgi:hypothetical protein